MSKCCYVALEDLGTIARGLNIEGCRPSYNMPHKCKWYNIVQSIDEPLKGDTFDDVMKRVHDDKYDLIESAVGIDTDNFIDNLVRIISSIKKNHTNLLVHVHQYTGTTILHKILQDRTHVRCILDKTNYYESPVDYRQEYPDIDGLISISQCAGLNLEAGEWIIPEYFINFDVNERIIYNIPIHVDNHIKDHVQFEYTEAPLLVADALWNPDIHTDQGYLVLDHHGAKVLNFVKENTTMFDESHDWHHAVNVAINSCQLLNTHQVLCLALLHDVCDHKYPNSIPRAELSEWIMNNIDHEYAAMIDTFIDQVSYSKQMKSGDMSKVHPVLEAVRDGDRKEAIGEIGILRCEQYSRVLGDKVPESVVKQAYEKILRIVPDGYIVNVTDEVIRRHNVVVDYVNIHDNAKVEYLKKVMKLKN